MEPKSGFPGSLTDMDEYITTSHSDNMVIF